eukprot:8084099-Pyramimonas_sp.AAC.1
MNLKNACFLSLSLSLSANRNVQQDVSDVLLNNEGSLLRAKAIQQQLPPGLTQQKVEDARA